MKVKGKDGIATLGKACDDKRRIVLQFELLCVLKLQVFPHYLKKFQREV
jgi:hypothetical protein